MIRVSGNFSSKKHLFTGRKCNIYIWKNNNVDMIVGMFQTHPYIWSQAGWKVKFVEKNTSPIIPSGGLLSETSGLCVLEFPAFWLSS